MTNRADNNTISSRHACSAVPTSGDPYAVLLTEIDLARRQRRSVKTIRNQRGLGTGIPFIKIGRLVRYRLQDVIASEEASLRRNTTECINIPELIRGSDR